MRWGFLSGVLDVGLWARRQEGYKLWARVLDRIYWAGVGLGYWTGVWAGVCAGEESRSRARATGARR